MKGYTYKKAGVDIEKAESLLEKVKSLAKGTYRKELLSGIGGFSSFMKVNKKYSEPVIVFSMDGVGTKLLLAKMRGNFFNVGIDLVAMNVNDILTSGAEPICFLDYIGMGKLQEKPYLEAVEGIVEGCKRAGCALAGGETAEMPGMYTGGEMEMVGVAVGVVEKKKIVDGRNVCAGDFIIGLPSSGVHSNGFSLVRKIFNEKDMKQYYPEFDAPLIDALLTSTRIYVKDVLAILKSGVKVKAMAHITGGGIPGNLSRVIPDGLCAYIDKKRWDIPFIFHLIKKKGRISDEEMFRTFNMGVGYIMIIGKKDAHKVLQLLEKRGGSGFIMGEIKKDGRKRVKIE